MAAIPDDMRGIRNRALLLIGFAGALRRSGLAAISVADVERTNRGHAATLKGSQGSQTEAAVVPIVYGRSSSA